MFLCRILLLSALYLVNSQVPMVEGNNNIDFATGTFTVNINDVSGTTSTTFPNMVYSIPFPSGFYSILAPSLYLSLNSLASSVRIAQLAYISFSISTTYIASTSFNFTRASDRAYYIQNLGYYFLIVSTKFKNDLNLNIFNGNLAIYANVSASGIRFTCSNCISPSYDSNGPTSGVVSIIGFDAVATDNITRLIGL